MQKQKLKEECRRERERKHHEKHKIVFVVVNVCGAAEVPEEQAGKLMTSKSSLAKVSCHCDQHIRS